MTVTIRRSTLVVLVAVLVIAAGVVVSQRASAASATPVVYVATGENFPDALGAASAAAVNGGPVLLVQKNSIPAETAAELSRLSPDVIYVAGGTAVVSDAVVNQLTAYASSVVRVAGANRYATAVEVSKSAFPATGGGTAALEARIAELEALLAGVTRNGDTLLLSGMNLQVVNGMGTTGSKNTLGNVIIGYNEWTQGGTPFRGGSHYLVTGDENEYRSWGGIIAGIFNTASGEYSSVTGGIDNTASGNWSSVTGGQSNTAGGNFSSVTSGEGNLASGNFSSVTGGGANTASAGHSSVTGGVANTASGENHTVVGGDDRTCSFTGAGVCGEGSWYALD